MVMTQLDYQNSRIFERQRHIQETCKFGDPRYPQLPSSNAQLILKSKVLKWITLAKKLNGYFLPRVRAACGVVNPQRPEINGGFRDAEHHYSLFDPTKHIQAGSSACSSVAHQTLRACLAASLIHTSGIQRSLYADASRAFGRWCLG